MRCVAPVRVHAYDVTVPCGKCYPCRKQRAAEWTVRLVHELEYFKRGVFATLTYEVPPLSLSISKRELQLFFKRLRRVFSRQYVGAVRSPWYDPGRRLVYYACGEYGEHGGLPHYHAIILGLGLEEHILEGRHYVMEGPIKLAWNKDLWSPAEWSERGVPGYIYVGTVTPQSIQYVTDYVQKSFLSPVPVRGSLLPAEPERSGGSVPAARGRSPSSLSRPFQLCSHGIGRRWCLANREQLVTDGFCRIDGAKRGLPRYYQKLLAEPDEFEVAQVCLTPELRAERAIERQLEVEAEASPIREVDSRSILRRRFFQRVLRDEALREVALKTLKGWSQEELSEDERIYVAIRRAVDQAALNSRAKERRKVSKAPF